jgi:hypothetical protein
VIAGHDVIVIACDAGEAQAADWLRRAMVDGMEPLNDPVPVAVEVAVGKTWAA